MRARPLSGSVVGVHTLGQTAPAAAASSSSSASPSLAWVWQEIQPVNGAFQISQGERYAILASVATGQSLDTIRGYLNGHGWSVTYLWEQGTATRGEYAVDDWLAGLPADTASGERWVYGEANRTGADTTIDVDKSFLWMTIYHVAHAFLAVQAPAQPMLPTTSSPGPSSSGVPWLPVAIGVAALAVGVWLWA